MSRDKHRASNVNDINERQHRFTRRKLITRLHDEFDFTMDATGHPKSPASRLIGHGYTLVELPEFLIRKNVFTIPWTDERVFLQPNFAKMEQAARYAHQQINYNGCILVVMLCPWDRQEQPWWHKYVEPYRDGRGNVETRALRGREKYGNPKNPEGRRVGCPNFPSGLVIWRGATHT